MGLGFFCFFDVIFFFVRINPLCIGGGLPESFAKIALFMCPGTSRGGLFGFSYFVFLFSGSSPADS